MDSFKLLPMGLNKLKASQTEGKLNFDPTIVNPDWLKNSANYDQMLSYLRQDCVLLSKILNVVNIKLNFDYDIEFHKFLTLPSLALGIFLSNSNHKSFIRPPSGNASQFIRNSYSGGRVEVFRPHFLSSEHMDNFLYSYDVNSLYPSVMMDSMPIGEPVFKSDNLNLNVPGFYEAVKSPLTLTFLFCLLNGVKFQKQPDLFSHAVNLKVRGGMKNCSLP